MQLAVGQASYFCDMFIKKDTRKVREILADSEDIRTHLKLARREAEFNGSTHVSLLLILFALEEPRFVLSRSYVMI